LSRRNNKLLYYLFIYSDTNYSSPVRKPTALPCHDPYITEFQVFRTLDRLRPTAMGLDMLLAWFLRLGAPAIYEPITMLFNLSLTSSFVQWKQASILPIPKTSAPTLPADFRAISIIPSFNSCHGADSRTTFPVSCLLVTTPFTDIIRSVCLSPYRLPNSCNN